MGEVTGIAWTDHTFNGWVGCQKVSPGCDHCYAEAMMDHRYGKVKWGPHGKRKRTSEANWKLPYRWERQAVKAKERRRVFTASLADVFDNKAPEGAREDLFKMIRQTPTLDWQLLTKRPENIAKMLPPDWGDGYDNVWLGTTAEDQEHYDRRWSVLRRTPAVVRFISYEPALGPLKLAGHWSRPDWIICGGESGSKARYMEPQWAYDVRDQCQQMGIAFFMKQMTKMAAIPDDLLIREFPVPLRRWAD